MSEYNWSYLPTNKKEVISDADTRHLDNAFVAWMPPRFEQHPPVGIAGNINTILFLTLKHRHLRYLSRSTPVFSHTQYTSIQRRTLVMAV